MDPPGNKLNEEELGGLVQQFQTMIVSSSESEEEETIIRETINHNDDIVNSIYGQWATMSASATTSSLPLLALPSSSSSKSSSSAASSHPSNPSLPPHRPPLPPSRQQRLDPPAILAKARSAITTVAKKAAMPSATAPLGKRRGGQHRSNRSTTPAAAAAAASSSSSSPEVPHLQSHQQRQRFILCTLFVVSIATVFFWGVIASRAESAAAATTSLSTSSLANHQHNNQYPYIGFHEPSYENMYGANHYYKPPGVGYSVRPQGGLHPIYMAAITTTTTTTTTFGMDDDDDDDNENDTHSSITREEELDNSEYYNDDYESSPYADLRLQMTDEERTTEQTEWKIKLQEIRDKYGYWNFRDDEYDNNDDKGAGQYRPVVDWLTIGESKEGDYNPLLGEIDKDDFPIGSWQTDDQYITRFITEGRKLVERVRAAIYEEYGWDEEGERENGEMLGGIELVVGGDQPPITLGGKNTVAWMYQSSFRALAKKLLNAMITNDHFFVTLGGHSAAAGHGKTQRWNHVRPFTLVASVRASTHMLSRRIISKKGNNFRQSYMMEFQHVMEPVFDRLGMVLVSANLAQGGMGTLQSALAGRSIYGDPDFMLWDSSMTEKDFHAQDTFMRQALMAGQRVPILFDMGGGKGTMDKLHLEVGAHIGGVTNAALLPKFKHTAIDFDEKKYNAACWTDRVDVHPDGQNPSYGGQASWHPGKWVHQSTARKISLLFLHSLDEAFRMWEEGASNGGNPLEGKYWHLHREEEAIRNALQTANATATDCGALFDFLPRICTTPMRGATEWTPRTDPDHSNIRSLVKPSPSGYIPGLLDVEDQVYRGRDPVIPSQRVPIGEVDVAAIARSLPPQDIRTTRRLLTSLSRRHHRRRRIEKTSNILPGDGWSVHAHPGGYCDGTLNAVCNRGKSFNCLMSGHNDARGCMKGDGLSGWLVLQLKDVTEGIFMARMEDWHNYNSNQRTEGWDEVNNGRVDERTRRMKAPPPPHPPEFRFEVAVNGVIISSWNSTEYKEQCHVLSYNNFICVLWNDEERALRKEKEDIEIAMRLGGDGGRTAMMAISHIYFA